MTGLRSEALDSSLHCAAFRMTVGSEVSTGVPSGNLGYTPLVKVFVKLGLPGAGMVGRRRPVIDATDYIELPEYM